MSTVAESLSAIRLGEPQAHQNLSLFPLLGEAANAPEYLLLEEALARGLVRVTEVSEGGSVPELLLVNEGERPGEPARFDAERLLEQTKAAPVERFPAVGLGEDLRLATPTLAGGALALDGRLVHLCAFAVPGEAGETAGEGAVSGTRLVRASRRSWGRLA